MSVVTTLQATCTVTETLDDSVASASTPVIVHDNFNVNLTLNATSDAPATNVIGLSQALTAGAATIDLTSLTQSGGGTFDATGLKLQVFQLKNGTGNAGAVTISDGASNGYNLFGDASGQVTCGVGGHIQWYQHDKLDDVGASDAEIDLSGTGTDSFDIIMVFG